MSVLEMKLEASKNLFYIESYKNRLNEIITEYDLLISQSANENEIDLVHKKLDELIDEWFSIDRLEVYAKEIEEKEEKLNLELVWYYSTSIKLDEDDNGRVYEEI